MTEAVVIRWWVDRSRSLVIYAGAFSVLLLVFAFRTGQFQALHRLVAACFAVVCAYFAAARVVNKTTMRVVDERLVVRHGPLPWRSNVTVPLTLVDDLGVDPASSRLQLWTRQGEEVQLMDDLNRACVARLDGQVGKLMGEEPEADAPSDDEVRESS